MVQVIEWNMHFANMDIKELYKLSHAMTAIDQVDDSFIDFIPLFRKTQKLILDTIQRKENGEDIPRPAPMVVQE